MARRITQISQISWGRSRENNLRDLVRQAKPGRSCDLKGGHHGNCPLTCSPASMRRSNPAGEASRGEDVSRSVSEPDSASLRSVRVARLPDWLKPAPATKQRADAVVGLSGVGGDGARRQIGRGTRETRPSGGAPPNAGRETITSHAAGAGSRSGPYERGTGGMPGERRGRAGDLRSQRTGEPLG